MDPLSFTASLITVAGLVAASSKKIYDLRGKLKDAPKDVESLLEQLRTFESLLKELKTQLQDHRTSAPPQETLQQVWGDEIAHMQRDVQSLQTVLSKVEPLLKKKSRSSKVLLLARQIIIEKEVEEYRRKIDTHCGTLTSIQATVCGRKLGKVSESIIQLGDEDRAGFRTISSELSQSTSQIGAEVKAGVSAMSSQIAGTQSTNEAGNQAVLNRLEGLAKSDSFNTEKMNEVFQRQGRSMDMNEAGFQAIHSSLITASSSGSEEHKKTQAMLDQCQGQLQQILREHITLGTVGHGVLSPSIHPKASKAIATETTVFWNHHSHRLPIGMLQIRLKQTRQTEYTRRSAPQVCTESEIAVEFVPPSWLSTVVINYSMKLHCDLVNSQWRWGATLRPLTVNYDSYFINAVTNVDVEGVRRSFLTGLANPTDYVLDRYRCPVPWYKLLSPNTRRDYSLHQLSRLSLMIDFMICDGLPGQEDSIYILSNTIKSRSLYDQELLRSHINNYLKHGGKVFTAGSSLFDAVFTYKVGRIDWTPEFLFNSSEPWLVDDLTSFQTYLIGTVANVDGVFRDRLKRELASYRSPASLSRTNSADNLFETTFSTASIESHFRTLQQYHRYRFLALLCRFGSVSMVRQFIDFGMDVNGSSWFNNLLGNAAACGNMEVVRMLLEHDANGSLAMKVFLHDIYSRNLSDALFKHLLELLVEHARPAAFDPKVDALLAIIESSRALCFHSKAPEILFDRGVFTDSCFGETVQSHWSPKPRRILSLYSYMYYAISDRNSSVVSFLLQKGAHANTRISHSFDCKGCWFESCTWLTFATMRGAASCADALIQHGADIIALDGAGRSAIQLAKNHAIAPHPRIGEEQYGYGLYGITAEEDAETLAVVERAFNIRFQGTKSLEDYLKLSNQCTLQPPPPQDKPISAVQKMLRKALRIFLTPTQTTALLAYLEGLYREFRKIWSLCFYEALLMRFLYVSSYALLLVLETCAFIKGHKRIPTPSRFFLSAVAVLMLALVWGSSQMGFSWVSITARAKSETDS